MLIGEVATILTIAAIIIMSRIADTAVVTIQITVDLFDTITTTIETPTTKTGREEEDTTTRMVVATIMIKTWQRRWRLFRSE
jgi:hypothetical protein